MDLALAPLTKTTKKEKTRHPENNKKQTQTWGVNKFGPWEHQALDLDIDFKFILSLKTLLGDCNSKMLDVHFMSQDDQ